MSDQVEFRVSDADPWTHRMLDAFQEGKLVDHPKHGTLFIESAQLRSGHYEVAAEIIAGVEEETSAPSHPRYEYRVDTVDDHDADVLQVVLDQAVEDGWTLYSTEALPDSLIIIFVRPLYA